MVRKAPAGHEFWLNIEYGRPVARVESVPELAEALKIAPAEVCKHHMKNGTNDFAEWIGGSLKQNALAARVKHVKLHTPYEATKDELVELLSAKRAKKKTT